MNRTLGLSIVAVWLAALAILLSRDVLPYWRAQDPPRGGIPDSDSQTAIRDDHGRRIGTSWVTIRHTGRASTWQSFTSIDRMMIPGVATVHSVGIDTTLDFQPDGTLGSFETHVLGLGLPIAMSGHLLGIDYSCLLTLDTMKKSFSLDARFSKQIGESMRPFTELPNLHVGQSWQLRILDPVSLMLHQTPEFKPILVHVTGLHVIEHRQEKIECFQVESDGAFAWVDHRGRVLEQSVTVPFIGKISLSDEPFNSQRRAAARRVFTTDAADAHSRTPNLRTAFDETKSKHDGDDRTSPQRDRRN